MNKLKRNIRNFLRTQYHKLRKVFNRIYVDKITKNKVENNLIVFESFFGRSINDNPKAIYDALDHNKYNRIFLVNDPSKYPEYQCIKRNTLKHYLILRKAKILITNQRMPDYWQKQEQQVLIQTWHGTPLKKLVHDLESFMMPSAKSIDDYYAMFDQDVANWDYLYSTCEYTTEKMRSAFLYQKEILEIGFPRNNQLYNYQLDDIKKIKEKLGIDVNKKVMLYAPTYRDDMNVGVGNYYFNSELDFKMLKEAFKDYEILIRYHYIITKSNDYNNENVINVTNYNNINDLYLISDILITDYSSVFFDYSILKRPFFFFAPDLEKYESELRGFYLDYMHDLVTIPTTSTNELIELIKKQDQYDFKAFSEKYNFESNKDCLVKTLALIDTLTSS